MVYYMNKRMWLSVPTCVSFGKWLNECTLEWQIKTKAWWSPAIYWWSLSKVAGYGMIKPVHCIHTCTRYNVLEAEQKNLVVCSNMCLILEMVLIEYIRGTNQNQSLMNHLLSTADSLSKLQVTVWLNLYIVYIHILEAEKKNVAVCSNMCLILEYGYVNTFSDKSKPKLDESPAIYCWSLSKLQVTIWLSLYIVYIHVLEAEQKNVVVCSNMCLILEYG